MTAVVQEVALGEADAGIVRVTVVAATVAQHEPVEAPCPRHHRPDREPLLPSGQDPAEGGVSAR
jgi:hypothetical protein